MRSINLVQYNKEKEKEWDGFVWDSRNGTFFHTRLFLSYHPEGKFKDYSLMFYKSEKLISVFPATEKIDKESSKRMLFSHSGASYGGFVIDKEVGGKDMLDIMDLTIGFAKEKKFDGIGMRLSPKIYHKYPCDEIEYALNCKGFKIKGRELSSSVLLSGFEDPMEIFSRKCRNATRKAMLFRVEVKESNDYEGFWAILKEALARHKATPTHSLDEIKKLKSLMPDKIRLFAAYYKGELIAGTVLFSPNENAAHTMYIASKKEAEKFRPLNLLFHYVISLAKSKRFKYLNFGISTENLGTHLNTGLLSFKESFGAKGVIRDSHELIF